MIKISFFLNLFLVIVTLANPPNVKDHLSFRNWSDRQSRGYCAGISYIEAKFMSANPSQLFNPKAPRDSAAVVEQKTRAFLNGQTVIFNGYSSLKQLSQLNENVFVGIVKEYQYSYAAKYKKGTPNPNAISPIHPQQESEKWKSIFRKLDSGQATPIAMEWEVGSVAMGHVVTGISYEDKGKYFLVKARDPNGGIVSLQVTKDANGNPSSDGFYQTAAFGRGVAVKFTTDYQSRFTEGNISRESQYTKSESGESVKGKKHSALLFPCLHLTV